MKKLCDSMGLEVLPETERIMGDKLDKEWDDSWPELPELQEHVRRRAKQLWGYLKHRRDKSHSEWISEMRAKGELPEITDEDRRVAEKALREHRKKLLREKRENARAGAGAARSGSGSGAAPPGATRAPLAAAAGAGAGAGAGPASSSIPDDCDDEVAGAHDVPAPAAGLMSASEVARNAGYEGRAQLTEKERAVLMEDRRNVFYEWKEEETFDQLPWRDMQSAVHAFVSTYRAQRVVHPDWDDDRIREDLVSRPSIAERARRLPMIFRYCTSRTSGPRVFEGLRRVIGAFKAMQEGRITHEEAYPKVMADLAEMNKEQRTPGDSERHVRIGSMDEALAMGATGVAAMRMGATMQVQQPPHARPS